MTTTILGTLGQGSPRVDEAIPRQDTSAPGPFVQVQMRELEQELVNLRTAMVCGFCQLLDLKDLQTGCHSTRLAEWAARIGRTFGLDTQSILDLEVAALLHDIGKIGIDDAILRNKGPLTSDETATMAKHPELGWSILRSIPNLNQAALFILHHHEHFDGAGYPAGLAGDEIPLGSRIVAVIDAFDAMISDRPYRDGLAFEESVKRLRLARGSQFDPEVVDRFLEIVQAEWSLVTSDHEQGSTGLFDGGFQSAPYTAASIENGGAFASASSEDQRDFLNAT